MFAFFTLYIWTQLYKCIFLLSYFSSIIIVMWIQFYNLICYNFLDINLYLTGYQLLSNSLFIEQLSHFCTLNVGQMENILSFFLEEWMSGIFYEPYISEVYFYCFHTWTHRQNQKLWLGLTFLNFHIFLSEFYNSSIFSLKSSIVEMVEKCLILDNPCITFLNCIHWLSIGRI